MTENPFKKVAGGKQGRPQAPKTPGIPQGEISEEAQELCPFIGTFPIMSAPKNNIIGPGSGMPDIQHVLRSCLESRCAMWSVEHKGCSVKLGSLALIEMKEPLMALGKTFGKP